MSEDGAHLSSLDDRAYLQLRDMIVRGALQPGEQLVQETLAEHLGLSRTPLRKAIATLAQEGFVEMTSRGAAFVRSFTDEELASIWEIRAVLEGLVCRTAARKAKVHHVAYLRSLITSAMEHVTPGNWTAYQEADREFHGYIAAVVDDPLLTRILDAYQILSITLAQGLLRPPEETLPEHLEILDAIGAGDAERAERAMVHHIRASLEHLRHPSRGGRAGSLPGHFVPVARAASAELVAAVGETACVTYRDGEEAVVLAAEEPERRLRVACPPDSRLPLHATAAGKVLLAARSATQIAGALGERELPRFTPRTLTRGEELLPLLEEVRKAGYAAEEEEHEEGVCGLAAPVKRRGETIAALSLLAPAAHFEERRAELLKALKAAAARIEKGIRA